MNAGAQGIHPIALDPTRWSMHPPKLAEGVLGYTIMVGNDLFITLLIADPPEEGHVGRYLDNLIYGIDTCKKLGAEIVGRIIVVESNSLILTGMLERRKFRKGYCEMPGPIGDIAEVWTYE